MHFAITFRKISFFLNFQANSRWSADLVRTKVKILLKFNEIHDFQRKTKIKIQIHWDIPNEHLFSFILCYCIMLSVLNKAFIHLIFFFFSKRHIFLSLLLSGIEYTSRSIPKLMIWKHWLLFCQLRIPTKIDNICNKK